MSTVPRPYRDAQMRMWFVHTSGCGQVVMSAVDDLVSRGGICNVCNPYAEKPPTPPAGWTQVMLGDPLPQVDTALLRKIMDEAYGADLSMPIGGDAA